jgi:hypothetical protein
MWALPGSQRFPPCVFDRIHFIINLNGSKIARKLSVHPNLNLSANCLVAKKYKCQGSLRHQRWLTTCLWGWQCIVIILQCIVIIRLFCNALWLLCNALWLFDYFAMHCDYPAMLCDYLIILQCIVIILQCLVIILQCIVIILQCIVIIQSFCNALWLFCNALWLFDYFAMPCDYSAMHCDSALSMVRLCPSHSLVPWFINGWSGTYVHVLSTI